MITIAIPNLRLSNPLNGARGYSRGAAMHTAKRRKSQRTTAAMFVRARFRWDGAPLVVTVTRISSGTLDPFDGLPASCKSSVDGIADALGINDRDPRVTWRAEQRKAKRGVWGVEIEIRGKGEVAA